MGQIKPWQLARPSWHDTLALWPMTYDQWPMTNDQRHPWSRTANQTSRALHSNRNCIAQELPHPYHASPTSSDASRLYMDNFSAHKIVTPMQVLRDSNIISYHISELCVPLLGLDLMLTVHGNGMLHSKRISISKRGSCPGGIIEEYPRKPASSFTKL